jgi:hypothetical protein
VGHEHYRPLAHACCRQSIHQPHHRVLQWEGLPLTRCTAAVQQGSVSTSGLCVFVRGNHLGAHAHKPKCSSHGNTAHHADMLAGGGTAGCDLKQGKSKFEQTTRKQPLRRCPCCQQPTSLQHVILPTCHATLPLVWGNPHPKLQMLLPLLLVLTDATPLPVPAHLPPSRSQAPGTQV